MANINVNTTELLQLLDITPADQYQLTDLDPALVSRFNIVNFRPTVHEWLLWARKIGVDEVDKRVPMWVPFTAEMKRNGPLKIAVSD